MVYKNSYLEKFQIIPPTVSNSKKVGFNASIHSLIDIKKNIDWLLAESQFLILLVGKFEQILKAIY